MTLIQELIVAITPSLLVGVIMFYFNRQQNKHFQAVEKRDNDRMKANALALQLSMANGKLTYAVAVAMKRGTVNGEVEEGIEAYNDARKQYLDFLNTQAIKNIHT